MTCDSKHNLYSDIDWEHPYLDKLVEDVPLFILHLLYNIEEADSLSWDNAVLVYEYHA